MSDALILSRDHDLLEELARLSAAAGASPQVAPDLADALRLWGHAGLVLLGADLVAELAALQPPRRDGVHIVSWGPVGHEMFRLALEIGAHDVSELPRSDAWVIEMLAGLEATAAGLTIGVVGGSGGAGATTFACALARTAAARSPSLVIDTDPLGPGLDRVLGYDRLEGVRWDALQQTTGRLSATSLREALPRREGLGALSWGTGPGSAVAPHSSLQAFAVREALAAGQRGHDVVVVDLSRRLDPLIEEVAMRCDHLLVVVVPTLAGVSAATRVVRRLGPERGPAGTMSAIVRGTRAGVAADAVGRAVGLPVLLEMPDQRGLTEAADLGVGPASRKGPLARAAATTLDRILADTTPTTTKTTRTTTTAGVSPASSTPTSSAGRAHSA